MSTRLGLMRERLTVLWNDAKAFVVSSLTRSSTTATATTAVAHGYLAGDWVTIAGSTISGWNARIKILTVPSTTTFTFTVSGSLTTPATGPITVTYFSNSVGDQVLPWRPMAKIAAESIALGTEERLAIEQIDSSVSYRFRVYARADLSAKQRVLWTPSAPRGSRERTLEIIGVPPMGDGRMFQYIEASDETT